MSYAEYEKEIKESLIDGGLYTTGFFLVCWFMPKLGISKPLTLTTENFLKTFGVLSTIDAGIAYAKKNKYIPT